MNKLGLKDKGCMTSAPDAAIFVSSAGDVLRKNKGLNSSSVNLVSVANAMGLDWKHVSSRFQQKPCVDPKLRRYNMAVDLEYERIRAAELTLAEHVFVKTVTDLHLAVCGERFRVYGELRGSGKWRVVLCTEFKELDHVAKVWDEARRVVRKTKAHVWVMDRQKHLDHVTYDYGTPKAREVIGPNHGKPETQIELGWRIEDMDVFELKKFAEVIKRKTQRLWELAGVSVI